MLKKTSGVVPSTCDGDRFDMAAVAVFTDLSRKKIKAILDKGGAYINKKRVNLASKQVFTGDKIELFWEENLVESSWTHMPDTWKAIFAESILDDNPNYVVINKPAGIPSQATLTSSEDTILHALSVFDAKRFPLASLFLVHRLDKDTSGVLIIAKSKEWQGKLETYFREGKMEKVYTAICFAQPKEPLGTISFPLEPDPSRKNTWQPVYKIKNHSRNAKSAITKYEVKETFAKCDASLITCYPKTGRTHQIRVHLLAIGCPLLGDKTYARNVIGHPLGQIAVRHMLHAQTLRMPDAKGGVMEWNAKFPADFTNCLEEIRRMENK